MPASLQAKCLGALTEEIRLRPQSSGHGSFSPVKRAVPWKRLPTGSYRQILKRLAARTPAAQFLSIVNWRAPTESRMACMFAHRSRRAMKSQGHQSETGPRELYRKGFAGLDRASKSKHSGKSFADLTDAEKDTLLQALENGDLKLDGADGKAFFEQAIKDVQIGFFADPIYGGNRDMAAWKMIGYPGARYNYLDWVNRNRHEAPTSRSRGSSAIQPGIS
jgi:hypothetical protein